MKWGGGEAPPNPRRTVAQGPDGPAFPLLPVGLSTPGAPRCGCSPRLGSTPLPTPPPSPPLAPGPAAAAALPAPEAAQCAQPHCGPAQTAKHLPLGRGGGVDQCVRARARAGWGLVGGGGRPGAEGGRGPAGPGTRASGAEEATGRAGEEQEKRGGGTPSFLLYTALQPTQSPRRSSSRGLSGSLAAKAPARLGKKRV
ncbi:unnamed protein product [Rangifer tarandus platyrhynchus]|uniref:Uncharacterized protein n=2 Tax=Rangifer tarandus platyrhynchus TaxID=3082113 RepID=A0ABN8ZTM4_RANTA|nr:unnamed protein product [Rangifer tarandus platyrhynchus]CAI9710512.1 unnamed protein product [Rangifer tarandus platyrhynchus]